MIEEARNIYFSASAPIPGNYQVDFGPNISPQHIGEDSYFQQLFFKVFSYVIYLPTFFFLSRTYSCNFRTRSVFRAVGIRGTPTLNGEWVGDRISFTADIRRANNPARWEASFEDLAEELDQLGVFSPNLVAGFVGTLY